MGDLERQTRTDWPPATRCTRRRTASPCWFAPIRR